MSINSSHEFFIQWHLTERCNLRCSHCYQTGKRTDELTFSEIRETAGEASEMLRSWADAYGIEFSPSVSVTGGEPFLRQDIFSVLEELGRQGFDLYLLSNGTLIDSEKAGRLSALGVKGVQVSIEGPEEIHEKIRGSGSFKSSLRGVSNLLEAGIRVTLNATLSGINAGRFREMVALAASLGVQRIGFSRLVPSGRGAGLIAQMIPPERVQKIYEDIFSIRPEGLEIVTGDPVASQMNCLSESGGPEIPVGGCAAGLSGLTFLPDGTIVPCRRLFVPIGNVREDRLREVWASSPVLEALRDKSRYKGKCGQCDRWSQCRGCRAIAYAWSLSKGGDDFLAEDPQCFIGP